jgi:hypothetical protein
MPVIINGSTGISGTDGSAANPAVQGSDTNTGMFFPAPDTIAFAEGGVESMRLDSSGNMSATNTVVMGSSFLRNRFINGAMEVWQRGTSFSTPAAGTYTADRFFVGWTGAAPATVARVTGPTGFSYALRVTGAASNTLTVVGQKIESVNIADLAGTTVTLSVVLLASSSQTFLWRASYANSVDNFTTDTQIATGTWSVTTSAARYTANITLPSQAANGVQINIYPANAGAFTSGTFNMTGFQIEAGTAATPFERRQYGQELMLCQRYYQIGALRGYSTTTYVGGHVAQPVPMRGTPTNTFNDQNGNANRVNTSNGPNIAITGGTFNSSSGIYSFLDAILVASAGNWFAIDYTLSAEL